jgi:hypothetical protein
MPNFADFFPFHPTMALFVHHGNLCVAPWTGIPTKNSYTEDMCLQMIKEQISVRTGWDYFKRIVDKRLVFRISLVLSDKKIYVPFLQTIYRNGEDVTTVKGLSRWASILGVVIPGPKEIATAGIRKFDLVKLPGVFDHINDNSMDILTQYLSNYSGQTSCLSTKFDRFAYQFEGNTLISIDRITGKTQVIQKFRLKPGFVPVATVWCGPADLFQNTKDLEVALLHLGVQFCDCDDPSIDLDRVTTRLCPSGYSPRGGLLFSHLPITWTSFYSMPDSSRLDWLDEDELVDTDDEELIELGLVRSLEGWVHYNEVSPPPQDETQFDVVKRQMDVPPGLIPTDDQLSALESGQTDPSNWTNWTNQHSDIWEEIDLGDDNLAVACSVYDETEEEYETGDPVFFYSDKIDPMETALPELPLGLISPSSVSGLVKLKASQCEEFPLWEVFNVSPALIESVLHQTLTIGVAPGSTVTKLRQTSPIQGSYFGSQSLKTRWVEGLLGLPEFDDWPDRVRFTRELCKIFSNPVVIQTIGDSETYRLSVESAKVLQPTDDPLKPAPGWQPSFTDSGNQYHIIRMPDPASEGWCVDGVVDFEVRT